MCQTFEGRDTTITRNQPGKTVGGIVIYEKFSEGQQTDDIFEYGMMNGFYDRKKEDDDMFNLQKDLSN